jgi:hypothetical protein
VHSLLRAAAGAIIAKDFGDFIATRRQERVVEAGKGNELEIKGMASF